eukprot:GHVO01022511.1.p1 GENE.GHVO01022511.1~~GHVO01022511.1.p1  ORF type:complete len:259 (+),score=28.43 GHVO01022511.1:587-1363(+)
MWQFRIRAHKDFPERRFWETDLGYSGLCETIEGLYWDVCCIRYNTYHRYILNSKKKSMQHRFYKLSAETFATAVHDWASGVCSNNAKNARAVSYSVSEDFLSLDTTYYVADGEESPLIDLVVCTVKKEPCPCKSPCVCDSIPKFTELFGYTLRIAHRAFDSRVITMEDYSKQMETLMEMLSGGLSDCLPDRLRRHLELYSRYKTAGESAHHQRNEYEQQLKASFQEILDIEVIPSEEPKKVDNTPKCQFAHFDFLSFP